LSHSFDFFPIRRQSGPYATDSEISTVFGYFYIYLLVAAVCSAGLAAALLTTSGKTRRSVREFTYYFDIFFRNGQHQVCSVSLVLITVI
jgi:hypothetical protein